MKLLITAGPTREAIDPVRFISNRSSGKMGYALAAAARRRGHDVVLVSGPVALPSPVGVRRVLVVTAEDMLAAVRDHLPACDALIMAAAVADYRPKVRLAQKWKKTPGPATLDLEPTPDILRTIGPQKGARVFVGFAAETERVVESAAVKCREKCLDLVVANDVSRSDAGFDVDTNAVTLVGPDGHAEAWPMLTKAEVAERLVAWVERKVPGAAAGAGVAPPPDIDERLGRQMAFIREIDKLKSVYRRTLLMDGARFENDAEHSWHLAVMAILLAEHANAPAGGGRGIDVARVIRLVLIHDLVEIDAGDTYCYDTAGHIDKAAREHKAADRIFGLLPADQQAEVRALWEEFEARVTPEARFAAALDRLQPLMHNFQTNGVVWRQHGVSRERVAERNHHVVEGSATLWAYAEGLIREAVQRGYLEA